MTKKLILALVVMAVLTGKLYAQQDPYYSFFMFNKMAYNPAYAGSKDAICVTGLYKHQWTGYQGAPETQTININAPIKQKNGIGFGIINDKLGYERSINATFSYARKFNIGSTGVLAAGLAGGFMQKSLDGTKLNPLTPPGQDPKIPVSKESDIQPDFAAGLYYTNTALYNLNVGLSATHLKPSEITYTTVGGATSTIVLRTHTYVTAGIEYPLSGSMTLEPNLLVKNDLTKWQVDANCFLLINNKFRPGIMYRSGDAITAQLGLKMSNNFHFGYSYDFTTSKILNFSSGSHEIYMTYCFNFKKPVPKEPNIKLTPRFL